MDKIIFIFCSVFFMNAHAQFTRADMAGSDQKPLHGYFQPQTAAKTAEKSPVIIAMHGCGGMLSPQGKPNDRTQTYAKTLAAQGWHVLFLDSFGGRGVKSICGGGKEVTLQQRVADVQTAVNTIAKRPDVDMQKIALLGWSHGSSTTLLATDKRIAYDVKPITSVVFYPGCGSASVNKGWQPAWPVLMQLGEKDDWTEPASCQNLAAVWRDKVEQDTYANAYHGFDSDAPLRFLKSIKSGVHLGGEPAAKAASEKRIIAYFKAAFK